MALETEPAERRPPGVASFFAGGAAHGSVSAALGGSIALRPSRRATDCPPGPAGGVNGHRALRRPDLRSPLPLPLGVLHELTVDPPHLGVRVVVGQQSRHPVGDPLGLPNSAARGRSVCSTGFSSTSRTGIGSRNQVWQPYRQVLSVGHEKRGWT
jgi:hypothetical protein